jgi:hypothetical protein
MAFVTTKKTELLSEQGTRFEVAVGNSCASILHSSIGWGGHANVPFTLKTATKEIHSTPDQEDGTQHGFLFLPNQTTTTVTLVMCDQEVVLTEEVLSSD